VLAGVVSTAEHHLEALCPEMKRDREGEKELVEPHLLPGSGISWA